MTNLFKSWSDSLANYKSNFTIEDLKCEFGFRESSKKSHKNTIGYEVYFMKGEDFYELMWTEERWRAWALAYWLYTKPTSLLKEALCENKSAIREIKLAKRYIDFDLKYSDRENAIELVESYIRTW